MSRDVGQQRTTVGSGGGGIDVGTGARTLRQRALASLDLSMVPADEVPVELAGVVATTAGRLAEPMRLAVAGLVNRGKSTLVNALLGTDTAPTGDGTLTANVCEFRRSDTPQLTVHYADGRPPEPVPVDRFRELSAFDQGTADDLAAIYRLEYGLPTEVLGKFHLIDLPGLGSVVGTDSAKSADTLAIANPRSSVDVRAERARRRAERDNAHELALADAALYVFDWLPGAPDLLALEQFVGVDPDDSTAPLTPMKAIGVLTRCDQNYWPEDGDDPDLDPIAVGRQVADKHLLRYPDLRQVLYRLLPVSGLLSMGAALLTDEQFERLKVLADADPAMLFRLLTNLPRFLGPSGDRLGVAAEHRSELAHRLGAWGIHRACRHVRRGMSHDQVRTALDEDSGVAEVRRTVIAHVGGRADLIKLDIGLRDIARTVAWLRRSQRSTPTVEKVADAADQLRRTEAGFEEVRVARDFHAGLLYLTAPEETRLRRLLGEEGPGCGARVGLGEDAAPAAVERAAGDEQRYWLRRAVRYEEHLATERAAVVLADLCHRIATRARAARRLLDGLDD